MKNLNYLVFLLLFAGLSFVSSCKKNKQPDPAPEPTDENATGTFMLHLHTYIDNTEVDLYNVAYSTDAGRKISLSIAQLYMSQIQLVKADGSLVDFSGKKILKVLDAETYIIGTAPVGNYKSFRFKIGLDPATNALSPTTPSDSALLNKPAMWLNTSAQPDGYTFLNVQGKIDTTANMSATIAQMQPFVYKIGTNSNYKQVIMPDKNFSIVKDQAAFGHVYIDYSKLFNGIKLYQPSELSVSTTAANSGTLAAAIVNNIPSMFIYEP